MSEVHITTFVNPYLFWIFDINLEERREALNTSLKDYLKGAATITASLNETVAVNHDNVWKRALVKSIIGDLYHCWLLDYGCSHSTHSVYQLPKEQFVFESFAKPACLNNVVGVKHKLDVVTMSQRRIETKRFGEGVNKSIKLHLDKAASIIFQKECVIDGFLCGRISLKQRDGVIYDLIEQLLKENNVAINKELFKEAFLEYHDDLYESKSSTVDSDLSQNHEIEYEISTMGRGSMRRHGSPFEVNKENFIQKWVNENDTTTIKNPAKSKNCNKEINLMDTTYTEFSNGIMLDKNKVILDKSIENKQSDLNVKPLHNETRLSIEKVTISPENRIKHIIKGRGKKTDVSVVGSSSPNSFNSSAEGDTQIENSLQIRKTLGGRGKLLAKIKSICNSLIDESVESEELFKDAKSTDISSQNERSSDNSSLRSLDRKSTSSESTPKKVSDDSEDSEGGECPPNQDHIIDIGCKCKTCQIWKVNDIGDENNQFKDHDVRRKKFTFKPPLLFKIKDHDVEITDDVEIKSNLRRNMTKIEKSIAPSVLVHGTQIPLPSRNVIDVPFHKSVHRALKKLKFQTAKTIQTYAWPSIMRLLNICIVNREQTGKTMAYLPAICSFVFEKNERYSQLPKENSPIVIILCNGVARVEETYDLFCKFLSESHKRVAITYMVPPFDNLKTIAKPTDILITTPLALVTILKLRLINLKRLCHFVIEEADKITRNYKQDFNNLMNVMQSMLEHRTCPYSVQIIACSEHWTIELENFIKRLLCVPLVCIGDHLESAFYGRADIQIHFIGSSVKMTTLCDILKEKSQYFKTVVICNDKKEMDDVVTFLSVEGVLVTAINDVMNLEEISELEKSWQNTSYGKHSALFCTDIIFNGMLNITNANLLVHYSLPPDSWTMFSKRFKCLIDSYKSPLCSKDSGSCKAHIFVDETNNKQFPRLYDFLQTVGAKLPKRFTHFCTQMKKAKEMHKLQSGVGLCEVLKLFGRCEKSKCHKRHIISEDVDFKHKIPQNGLIKFKILSVQDVAIYIIRLIEHTDVLGKVTTFSDYSYELGPALSEAIANRKIHVSDPTIGKKYAWFDEDSQSYHRCKILSVNSCYEITNLPREVTIKLIDNGLIEKVSTSCLFKLPQNYKDIPAQGIKMYLANILPPHDDDSWRLLSKQKVIQILKDARYENSTSYFTGRIMLQLSNNLWLENVRLVETLKSIGETVTILLLKKELLDKTFAVYKTNQLDRLYELCVSEGIKLPNYECPIETTKRSKVKQIAPQWAHLEDDSYNAVYFCSGTTPHKFYVRLQKFDDLFLRLQKDIQTLISKPFYPKVGEIEIGNYYLAKDQEEFGRALVVDVKDDVVDCFFVDYGDSMFVLKDEIKFLPDKYITVLPFQAIECTLFGVKPAMDYWLDEASDVLYEYCFEPGTDIYRQLYASIQSTMKGTIGSSRKYSILLVDYFTQNPVVVNKILIDCGFAIETLGESLTDIRLPQLDEDNCDDDFDNNELQNVETQEHASSDSDIEINNDMEFFNDIFDFQLPDCVTKSFQGTSNINALPPMRALSPVDYNTPEVLWFQTEKYIKIDILIPNVNNYNLQVVRDKRFMFRAVTNGQVYKLNFQLYDAINKPVQSSAGGLVVKATLNKREVAEWPRLTFSETKLRNIKYDVSKCSFPEEKKRLFLNIGEDRKDEVAEGPITEIGSDLDYSESDLESHSSD